MTGEPAPPSTALLSHLGVTRPDPSPLGVMPHKQLKAGVLTALPHLIFFLLSFSLITLVDVYC